jgi:TetR/AcrR family tetracycline transcriptional repressor
LIVDVTVSDDTDAPWHQRIRAVMVALVDVLRAHPNVAELATTRILASTGGLKLTEDVLALLSDVGFSTRVQADIACLALQNAIMLVNGEPGAEQGIDPEDREAHRLAKRAMLAALPAESFPHLLAAADDLLGCNDTEGYYQRGIDLFIAGIQGLPRTD